MNFEHVFMKFSRIILQKMIVEKINEILESKEKYNDIATQFWEDNYSDAVISKKWNSFVDSKVGENV